MKNRDKVIDLLNRVSTPEERAKIKQQEETRQRVAAIVDAVKPLQKEIEKAKDDPDKQYKMMKHLASIMSEGFVELTKALTTKLDEVKMAGYNGSKGQENFALTMQNMAKSLAEGLNAVKDSVDKKPVPVWKWPQYLYSGLRNKTFAPINPATDGIGIGDYDYVSVTYPVNTTEVYTFYNGGVAGTLVATVTVVYTTSTKDVLSSVTKTPLTL